MKEFVTIVMRTFVVIMKIIIQIEVEVIERHHILILAIIKY